MGASPKLIASTTPVQGAFKESSNVVSTISKETSCADSSAISTARTSNIECFKCKSRGI